MSEDSRRQENEAIKEWLRCVDGVIVGNKRKVTYKPVKFDPKYRDMEKWFDETTYEATIDVRDEDVCVVEIPRRHLISMQETQDWYTKNSQGFTPEKFDRIIRSHFEEKQLREMNPAVKEAWEKYKVILALCSKTNFNDI